MTGECNLHSCTSSKKINITTLTKTFINQNIRTYTVANLSFENEGQNCAFRGRLYESVNRKRKIAFAQTRLGSFGRYCTTVIPLPRFTSSLQLLHNLLIHIYTQIPYIANEVVELVVS